MKPTRTKSEEQYQTEVLFEAYLEVEANWTSAARMVANLFEAHYISALPVAKIEAMVQVCNSLIDKPDLQPLLTKLVRAKVLRSRIAHGVKFYEVNY